MVRLFQLELEHYEKIEGTALSLEGKANRLGADDPRQPRAGDAGPGGRAAVRRLRPSAAGAGRIFSYDVTGGRYEEHDYHAVGLGSAASPAARSRSSTAPTSPTTTRCDVAVEALYDAADDDSATGGPDLARGIFPVVAVVDRRRRPRGSPTTSVAPVVDAVVAGRPAAPGRPAAAERGRCAP